MFLVKSKTLLKRVKELFARKQSIEPETFFEAFWKRIESNLENQPAEECQQEQVQDDEQPLIR
jgi:hypothetical protein